MNIVSKLGTKSIKRIYMANEHNFLNVRPNLKDTGHFYIHVRTHECGNANDSPTIFFI